MHTQVSHAPLLKLQFSYLIMSAKSRNRLPRAHWQVLYPHLLYERHLRRVPMFVYKVLTCAGDTITSIFMCLFEVNVMCLILSLFVLFFRYNILFCYIVGCLY